MSKKEEDASLVRKSQEDKAHERNTSIRMAVDALADARNASDKEVLDKTRDIVRETFSGRGESKARHQHRKWNKARTHHEYKDSTRQARANPPSQYSSSSSSSAGPSILGKQGVVDAALKEEKWRRAPTLKRAWLHDHRMKMAGVKRWRHRELQYQEVPAEDQPLGRQPTI